MAVIVQRWSPRSMQKSSEIFKLGSITTHEEAIDFFKQLNTQREHIERSQQLLEKNLAAARRTVQEEEMRLRQIQEDLAVREQ